MSDLEKKLYNCRYNPDVLQWEVVGFMLYPSTLLSVLERRLKDEK